MIRPDRKVTRDTLPSGLTCDGKTSAILTLSVLLVIRSDGRVTHDTLYCYFRRNLGQGPDGRVTCETVLLGLTCGKAGWKSYT